MKLLKLTTSDKVLTEEAQQRQDAFDNEYLVDSSGRGFEEWDNLGIPPSKELLEKENEELVFEDSDYEYLNYSLILNIKEFCYCLDEEESTVVYTKSGNSLRVAENCEEIEKQILCLHSNVFSNLKMWIIKNIQNGIQKLFAFNRKG